MDLDGPLRARTSLKVERPPTMWEADTQTEPFLLLLGELIALGLGRGNRLEELTLNVSNVVVEADRHDGGSIPEGEFVAISVRGAGSWDDDAWRPGTEPATGSLRELTSAAADAGAVYASSRNLGAEGSVTVFLPRLPEPR